MGGGNGAKAAQKRERNAKNAAGGAKSQLKVNEAAKSIQCGTCKQTFLQTSNEKTLNDHVGRHKGKSLADCFPNFNKADA